MPRFCTRCGAPAADDAKFCDACGHALPPRPSGAAAPTHPVLPAIASAPALSARPSRAGGTGARRPLLWGAGAGVLLLLLIIAGGVWWLLGRNQGPSPAQADAIAQAWLQKAQPELMQKACLRNFNYSANPVFVNAFDTQTQAWLNTLVKAGIYTAGRPVQNGFFQQIRYAHGPNAPTFIRNGALCVASGVAIAEVRVMEPKAVQAELGGRSPLFKSGLPPDWAVLKVRWQWKDLAPWASEPAVVAQFGDLQPQPFELLAHAGPQGWTLSSPLELDAALAQQPMAGERLGRQSGAFGFSLPENPQTAETAAPSGDAGGLLAWVQGLFGAGASSGAAEASLRYIRDIEAGKFDDAYALLAPGMQAAGRDALQLVFSLAQGEIQRRGGIASIEVARSRDTAGGRQLAVRIRYNNGTVETWDMLLVQSAGRWRIAKAE